MINEKDIKKRLLKFSNRLSDLKEDAITNKGKTRELQATEMEITKSNLSKYCASNNADKDVPRLRADTLMRIAEYYDVSVDYLLGYTDCPTSLGCDKKELIRAISDYTGLNETAINNLQKAKKHYFKKLIINEILSNEDLIEELIMYYAASFLDLYKSSHYHNLTQFFEFSDILEYDTYKAKKMQSCSLQDCLALSREDFYKNNISDYNHKLAIVLSMAQIFVDPIWENQKEVSLIEEGASAIGLLKLKKREDIVEYRKKLLEEIKTQELTCNEPRFNSDIE